MPPASFTPRREAECLAIAMAVTPGLAANPVLLPSLAKYMDHPQSSCLLFLTLQPLPLQTLLLSPPRLPSPSTPPLYPSHRRGLQVAQLARVFLWSGMTLEAHLLPPGAPGGASPQLGWVLRSTLLPLLMLDVSSPPPKPAPTWAPLTRPHYCSYTLPSPKLSEKILLNSQ